MVSTSWGISILFTASIFFESAGKTFVTPGVAKVGNFWKSELHFLRVECKVVLPAHFQKD